MNVPRTGKMVRGGMLVTKTLLFAGATEGQYGDPYLQAFDKRTGDRIATVEMPGLVTGVPMTFSLSGKQYIVVAVAGRNHPAELVALTLPSASGGTERVNPAAE